MFILLILIIMMSIYYKNFLKFLIFSEIIFINLYLNFNFLLNINNMNFSIFFISLMIIESSLGIILFFELIEKNKIIFSSNLYYY